jgi:hypothetical protein
MSEIETIRIGEMPVQFITRNISYLTGMKFLLQKNNGEINVGLALTTRSILNHGG